MRVQAAGDLEILFLHETHDLLAHIISNNYFTLLGDEVRFHHGAALSDFFLHVEELKSGGREKVAFPGAPEEQSLLSVGDWFVERASGQPAVTGLQRSSRELQEWLAEAPEFKFYSGELGRELVFPLSRGGMIYYFSNLSKHRLLRLGSLLAGLTKLLAENGQNLNPQELVGIREDFQSELQRRLLYLSTRLVELLGRYFQALNEVVVARRNGADLRNWQAIAFPPDTSSDVFRSLYVSVLVSHAYPYSRIADFIPATPPHLLEFY